MLAVCRNVHTHVCNCCWNRSFVLDGGQVYLANQENFHKNADKAYWKAVAELLPKELPPSLEPKGRKNKDKNEKKSTFVANKGPKPGKPTDLGRMRQVLLKLKHNPPAHMIPPPPPPPKPETEASKDTTKGEKPADTVTPATEPAAVPEATPEVAPVAAWMSYDCCATCNIIPTVWIWCIEVAYVHWCIWGCSGLQHENSSSMYALLMVIGIVFEPL